MSRRLPSKHRWHALVAIAGFLSAHPASGGPPPVFKPPPVERPPVERPPVERPRPEPRGGPGDILDPLGGPRLNDPFGSPSTRTPQEDPDVRSQRNWIEATTGKSTEKNAGPLSKFLPPDKFGYPTLLAALLYQKRAQDIVVKASREDRLLTRSERDAITSALANKTPSFLYMSAPETDEQFFRMFRYAPDPEKKDLATVIAARERVHDIDPKGFVTENWPPGMPFGDTIYQDELTQFIHRSGDVIFLMGHNVNGELIFPNRATRKLSDIALECAKLGKICVFLSCESAQYVEFVKGQRGVLQRLDYPSAICIAEAMRREIARQRIRSYDDIDAILQRALTDCLPSPGKIGTLVMASVGGGLLIGLVAAGGYVVYQTITTDHHPR